jgi:hypothetical protein
MLVRQMDQQQDLARGLYLQWDSQHGLVTEFDATYARRAGSTVLDPRLENQRYFETASRRCCSAGCGARSVRHAIFTPRSATAVHGHLRRRTQPTADVRQDRLGMRAVVPLDARAAEHAAVAREIGTYLVSSQDADGKWPRRLRRGLARSGWRRLGDSLVRSR